jgi:D-tyrosyl-tRNA(Tyr) deacylase
MKTIIQRVQRGSVTVEGQRIAEIGRGLVILVGIGPADTEDNARALARKIAMLRIFEDEQGKMNRSVLDVQGKVIVVSQFTLYADTRKGNRPAFTDAAPPALAKPLCERFAQFLREQGLWVQEGEFGAHMIVEIINDGPVTIQIEN